MEATEVAQAPAKAPSIFRPILRFGLHLLAVYAIVNITTLRLAGFVHWRLLPLIQDHSPTISSLQFTFSHLFLFSFYPAATIAFLYAHWYRHKVACFVWLVPIAILAYKFVEFQPTTSVLATNSGQFAAAFHHYVSGDFMISEFHSFRDLFQEVASNSDVARGLDQLRYTAPLYAAVGYSTGTLIGLKLPSEKLHSALESMRPNTLSRR